MDWLPNKVIRKVKNSLWPCYVFNPDIKAWEEWVNTWVKTPF